GVDAGEARQIKTFQLGDGKTTTLWVAPTRDGGFCDILAGALVGCRSGADNGSASKYVIGFGITPPRGAMPFTIAGDVAGKSGIERLQIAFQDGDRADIPLTWIGPPIGAAFYLYEVPASERSIGHRPSVLIGMDATGNEVATQPLPTELTKPMPAGG